MKLKNKKKLKNLLEELLNNYPKNWELKILLADIYRTDKNYSESIDLYSEIIDGVETKNKWSIFYSRGIAFERLDNWKKAEEDLKMAMKLQPNDPYIINYLAYSWLDRNMNIDKALNLLEKAVELEPSDGYILDSLDGLIFYQILLNNQFIFLKKLFLFYLMTLP